MVTIIENGLDHDFILLKAYLF